MRGALKCLVMPGRRGRSANGSISARLRRCRPVAETPDRQALGSTREETFIEMRRFGAYGRHRCHRRRGRRGATSRPTRLPRVARGRQVLVQVNIVACSGIVMSVGPKVTFNALCTAAVTVSGSTPPRLLISSIKGFP